MALFEKNENGYKQAVACAKRMSARFKRDTAVVIWSDWTRAYCAVEADRVEKDKVEPELWPGQPSMIISPDGSMRPMR